jgi:hypothetical protein
MQLLKENIFIDIKLLKNIFVKKYFTNILQNENIL